MEVIKPLEKKYTNMCILYSIFKLKCFEKKRNLYNKQLISYYRLLQKDARALKQLEKLIK